MYETGGIVTIVGLEYEGVDLERLLVAATQVGKEKAHKDVGGDVVYGETEARDGDQVQVCIACVGFLHVRVVSLFCPSDRFLLVLIAFDLRTQQIMALSSHHVTILALG